MTQEESTEGAPGPGKGRFVDKLAQLDEAVEQSRRAREAAEAELKAALSWQSPALQALGETDNDVDADGPRAHADGVASEPNPSATTSLADVGEAAEELNVDSDEPTPTETTVEEVVEALTPGDGHADAEVYVRGVVDRLMAATRGQSQSLIDQMQEQSLVLIDEARAELVRIASQIADELKGEAEEEAARSLEERLDGVAVQVEQLERELSGEARSKAEGIVEKASRQAEQIRADSAAQARGVVDAAREEADEYRSRVLAEADALGQRVTEEAIEQAALVGKESADDWAAQASKLREQAEREVAAFRVQAIEAVNRQAEALRQRVMDAEAEREQVAGGGEHPEDEVDIPPADWHEH